MKKIDSKILKISADFKKKMQRIVDKDDGITGISLQFGDDPPILIAGEKKKDSK